MDRAVTSLAMVKIAFSKYKRDYIENFVPFVATLIKKKEIVEIDTANLQPFIEEFKQEFGLIIPYHPILTILERTRKRGVVKRSYSKLLPENDKVLQYDFSDVVLKKDSEMNQVLSQFITFCREKYSCDIDINDAQDGFIAFLRAHDLDVLFAAQNKTLLPEMKASRQIRYLLAAFVQEARENAPQIFNSITELCLGHVLANTILYAGDFAKFKGRLKNLELYLDTRFIFRLLGIEGELYAKVYNDLLLSIHEQEARLYVFQHTIDEISFILRNCLKWIDSSDYDPAKASNALQYFIHSGKNKSDIHQYLGTIENRLRQNKIEIKNSPNFTLTPQFQIDEQILTQKINDIYSSNPYFDGSDKQTTIDRDVKSISSIYHLRNGKKPQTIKQAGCFFVTTNRSLAYVSKMFERDISGDQFSIPVCITDVFLGTLVWMQSPVKWVSLNEKKIIADCTAVLRPDSLFIKRLVEEAGKLKNSGKVNEDEFLIVSRSYFVQEELMKETLGDPDAITTQSLEEIIQKVRTDAAYPVAQELKKAKEITEQLEKKLSSYESSELKRRLKVEVYIKKIVSRLLAIGFVVFLILFIGALIVSFIPSVGKAGRIIACLVAVSFGILNVGYGFNLRGLKVSIKEWFCRKIISYIGDKLFLD